MKIKKMILLILFAAITLAVNVSAREKVYSDENISFRYDDECPGSINRFLTEEELLYSFDSGVNHDGTGSGVIITFDHNPETSEMSYQRLTEGSEGTDLIIIPGNGNTYKYNRPKTGECIVTGEILYHEEGFLVTKELAINDDQTYLDAAKALYDSVTLPENVVFTPYNAADETSLMYVNIYEKTAHSYAGPEVN